jgi:drug/metabolite transporter (DMT)-like permease
VAVLLSSWVFGLDKPNLKVFFNVSFIVIGVMIASFGEIKFQLIGFLFQIGGVAFEAIRLTMVQRLLSSAEFKMDPLVSFYYFAPVCAIMNGIIALFIEVPHLTLDQVANIGYGTLLLNGLVAFGLNVSVVFLVSSFYATFQIPANSLRLVVLLPL